MSLLSVVRRACIPLGLSLPSSIANAGKIVEQLVELARMDAEELALRHDWQELEADHSFQTVAAEAQPEGLPKDFGRFAYGGEIWNRSRNERLCTLSREAWEAIRAGHVGGIYPRTRIRGGVLYLVPAPPEGETIAFPYISSNLYSRDGVLRATWDQDGDLCRLPENVIALGVIWRWRAARGFAYAEDMQNYERQLALSLPLGPEIRIGRPMFDGLPPAYPGALGGQ